MPCTEHVVDGLASASDSQLLALVTVVTSGQNSLSVWWVTAHFAEHGNNAAGSIAVE